MDCVINISEKSLEKFFENRKIKPKFDFAFEKTMPKINSRIEEISSFVKSINSLYEFRHENIMANFQFYLKKFLFIKSVERTFLGLNDSHLINNLSALMHVDVINEAINGEAMVESFIMEIDCFPKRTSMDYVFASNICLQIREKFIRN